jgi:hypothetical protein
MIPIISKGNKPLIKGKFSTVTELNEKIAECKALGRSQAHCARICGVSRSKVAKVYQALCDV